MRIVPRLSLETLKALKNDAPQAVLLSFLIFAGFAATLFILHRSQESQVALVEALNEPGLRTIELSASSESRPISASSIEAISRVDAVDWVLSRGSAQDWTNARLRSDLIRVPVSPIWIAKRGSLVLGCQTASTTTACLETGAFQDLQFSGSTGGIVRFPDGPSSAAISMDLPFDPSLNFLEAGGFYETQSSAIPNPTVYVRVKSESTMASVVPAIRDMAEQSAGAVRVDSADEQRVLLSNLLDQSVQDAARSSGWITGAVALAVWIVTSLATLNRRQDNGRRRVLGATRSMIVALAVGRVVTLTAGVTVLATLLFAVIRGFGGTSLGWRTFLAVCAIQVISAILSAIPAALLAGSVDPLKEFRVP